MTFKDEIQPTEVPVVRELYQFDTPAETVRLTSHITSVDWGGERWQRAVVTRGPVNRSLSEKTSLDVQVQANSELLRLVASYTLPTVRLTLYQVTDTSSWVLFCGEATGITLKGDMLNLTFATPTERLRFVIPRFHYRVQCNNALFDANCALSPSSWVVVATVSGSGSTLTAPALASYADGWFTLGWAKFGNEYRLITNHTGQTIRLQVPFDQDPDNQELWIYPGCDGSPDTCKNKFNNFSHFNGFPFIPTQNPTLWGLGEPKIP